MSFYKTLRLSIIPLFALLSACGGGIDTDTSRGGPHPADYNPTVDCANPTTLDKSYLINGSPVLVEAPSLGATNFTTVTLESVCYLVTDPLNIPDFVQLTILPGTVMKFSESAGLTITGGSIIAQGTPSAPITFTDFGNNQYWAGIRVLMRNVTESVFDYTIIDHAGKIGDKNKNAIAAFSIIHHRSNSGQSKGRLTFTNSVIRNTHPTSDYAFSAGEFSYLKEFGNNTIYANPVDPISITYNEVHFINNTNLFTHNNIENDSNKIVVLRPLFSSGGLDTSNSTPANFAREVLWRAHTIPYLIKDNMRVTNTKLTLEAGTKIQFTEQAGISIENEDAALSAIGTATRPIEFSKSDSSAQPVNSWLGIQLTNSSSFQNKLDFVNIYFAGNNNLASTLKAGLIVKFNSHIHVSHSSIQSSPFGYGFYLDSTSSFNSFDNNVISGNAMGAGLVATTSLRYLDASTDYTNNDTNNGLDYIEVLSPENGIGDAATIPGINAPYAFLDSLEVNGSLTIEPGAKLLFANGEELRVRNNNHLRAEGTEFEPIIFSSLTQRQSSGAPAGYWRGIVFNGSSGYLDNVKIEFSGFNANPGFITAAGVSRNSTNGNRSSVELYNSDIVNLSPGAYSVYIETNSQLISNPATNNLDVGTCKQEDFC